MPNFMLVSLNARFLLKIDLICLAIGILSYFFHIMSEYDKTFGPKVLRGHCDLMSWLGKSR